MKKHIQKIPTANMSRADWLAERKKSLGGSDMGAVLGLNPWRSPYAVWAEKTGRLTEDRETEAMRIGRDLEPYVAQRFSEASGMTVRRLNAILRNPAFPHIHANIDREISGISAGLECKTASALNEKAFGDGVFPANYYAQCVTYLAVTEYKRWYLAVLVMGREFKVYQMTREPTDVCPDWCENSTYVSDEEISALKDAAEQFWELVETDTPPAVDGAESTTETLQSLYAEPEQGRTVDLSMPSIESAVNNYLRLKAEEKERKRLLDEQANIIKEYMKEAERGVCRYGNVSWLSQTRETFDRKAFEAAHPGMDLSDFCKTTNSRIFKITAKKKGA